MAASIGTNDYPSAWQTATDCSGTYGEYSWCVSGSDISPLGFGYRNCTDYAAYELNEQLGGTVSNPKFSFSAFGFNPSDGNAAGWKSAITAKLGNQAANNTPAVGSVAWYNSTWGGGFGHVAIVSGVTYNTDGSANSITVADYNYAGTGVYDSYSIASNASNWPDGFLHIADVSGGGGSATPRVIPLQYGSEMDIFKRGSDNHLWKDTIQAGSNNWSGWNNSLGGTFVGDPAADQYGAEMDVFVTNANGDLYQNTYQPSTASWSGWQYRASGMAGDPVSIAYNGMLYVFSRGTDGNLYVVYWNGISWISGRIAGNGAIAMGSSPTVTVYGSEMDVYIRGTDSNLWKSGTTDGVNFGNLGNMGGGNLENDPKAITYGAEMDVYANNTSGTLMKDTWNGSSWSGFNPLTGASFQGSPTAMQYNSGEMDVYDRGISDSRIYKDTWQAGGTSWSGWSSLGGNEQGDPTALQWGTEMDVYATNYANNTDKDTWLPANNNWSGFQSLL
jgi:hypothetical protein